MRTTSERIAELNRRIKKVKAKQQLKRKIISSFAACFFLMIGASCIVPSLAEHFGKEKYSNTEFAASLFARGEILEFILVGTIAFALGVCVTILCYRFHRLNHKEKED